MSGGVQRVEPWQKAHGRKRGHLKEWEGEWLARQLPGLAVPVVATREELLTVLGADPATARLWLEIGFGNGEYLAYLAGKYPGDRFIGVEVFMEGIAGLLKRLEVGGLGNVRVVQCHAHELIATLPLACLDRVIVNFPDPWPKSRHHKRRLVQAAFLDVLVPRMVVGGLLTLATDWAEYAQWMVEVLDGHPAFVNRAGEGGSAQPEDWITTRFEAKGRAVEREIFHMAYERRG